MISTTVEDGHLYEVVLEDPGRSVLEERGLIPDAPPLPARPRPLRKTQSHDRAHRIGDQQPGTLWRTRRFPDDPQEARLEANYALHADLTPRLPDPDELSVEIANCRAAITTLGDNYLQTHDSLDAAAIDNPGF